jgi:Cd2+/Zn2+-exporting ATPase
MRFKGVWLLGWADHQPTTQAPPTTGSAQAVYRIENMDCPTEEALIRGKLVGLAGVVGLEFNLMQRTLTVQHELPSLSPVEQALKAIGMQAVRMDEASAGQTTKLSIAKMDCPTEEALIRNKLGTVAGVTGLDFNLMQRTLSVRHADGVLPDVLGTTSARIRGQVEDKAMAASPSASPVTTQTNWWPLGISLIAASAAEAVYWFHNGNHWSVVILALVAVLTGGLSTYKKGWIALKNRNLNMNALMSIAVTGAMFIGHWPEAAMVMVLFALAEVIEAKSLDRARNAIRGLLDLTPEQATVQQPDGTWREQAPSKSPLAAASGSNRVSASPSMEVLEGRSTVNQAPITGESLPVENPRRSGVRGHDQRIRFVRVPRHRRGQQLHFGPHHSRGRGCAR